MDHISKVAEASSPPPDVSISEEDTVEAIVAHRWLDGGLEYLVHWRGASIEDDEWFSSTEVQEFYASDVAAYQDTPGVDITHEGGSPTAAARLQQATMRNGAAAAAAAAVAAAANSGGDVATAALSMSDETDAATIGGSIAVSSSELAATAAAPPPAAAGQSEEEARTWAMIDALKQQLSTAQAELDSDVVLSGSAGGGHPSSPGGANPHRRDAPLDLVAINDVAVASAAVEVEEQVASSIAARSATAGGASGTPLPARLLPVRSPLGVVGLSPQLGALEKLRQLARDSPLTTPHGAAARGAALVTPSTSLTASDILSPSPTKSGRRGGGGGGAGGSPPPLRAPQPRTLWKAHGRNRSMQRRQWAPLSDRSGIYSARLPTPRGGIGAAPARSPLRFPPPSRGDESESESAGGSASASASASVAVVVVVVVHHRLRRRSPPRGVAAEGGLRESWSSG